MKQIIDYFDRAYIINLADRTDRRRQAVREFDRVGHAIPSDKVQFYTATRLLEKGGFKDVGTRGNFTSHRAVLELAHSDGLRNILVFEDDVTFRNITEAHQRQIIDALSIAEWDVTYFAYLLPSDEGLSGPLQHWPQDVLGAHFYAVNGNFIPTMLKYMHECEHRPRDHPLGGPMTADGAYNHVRYVMPDVRVLLAVPSLAHQRSSRTDIAPTGPLDRIGWLEPFVRGARAIKHRVRMAIDDRKVRDRSDTSS